MQMKPQQLNVELGEKESEGIYSNMVMIAQSPHEIILDFARMVPGQRKTKIYARIIMTPAHAKMLHKALEDNLKKFEGKYGVINLPGGNTEEKNIGFQSAKNDD